MWINGVAILSGYEIMNLSTARTRWRTKRAVHSMGTRRSFLIGSTCVAALAIAALGWRAWDRGVWAASSGEPYEPWNNWHGHAGDGNTRPLRAAILAANPHDTQPWLFEVAGNTITVFADRARNLGALDPFRREMHLGLGAAIENLVVSARAFGMAAEVRPTDGTLAPSPDNVPVSAARIVFTPALASRDVLFHAIPNRHTNRGAYRADLSIGAERRQRFLTAAESSAVRIALIEDAHARRELGAMIVEATERIVGDPQMSADSASWFRVGRRDIEAHRDGVTIDTSGASWTMTAISKLLPDLDPKSADRYWLSMTRETHVATAPALGIILVRDRLDMQAAIDAGRCWQRLHLLATAEGLAAQPLNQPVEWVDRAAMLGKSDALGVAMATVASAPGWQPTFVFRLGSAEHAAAPSPRRPLEEVIRAS
jgi:hypothetical protein